MIAGNYLWFGVTQDSYSLNNWPKWPTCRPNQKEASPSSSFGMNDPLVHCFSIIYFNVQEVHYSVEHWIADMYSNVQKGFLVK